MARLARAAAALGLAVAALATVPVLWYARTDDAAIVSRDQWPEAGGAPSHPAAVAENGEIRVRLEGELRLAEGFAPGLATGQSGIRLTDAPCKRPRREPDYLGQVGYGCIGLGAAGDRLFLLALDRPAGKPWRLYFDGDNDGDLTNDGGPLFNQGTGKFAYPVEARIKVVGPGGSLLTVPYRLWLWADAEAREMRFYAQAHFAGTLAVGSRRYAIAAFEARAHDGLFHEDGLWIDADGDGRFGDGEHFADGAVVGIGGRQATLVLEYR